MFSRRRAKIGGEFEGRKIFARLPKQSPTALLVQSRTQQKSFLFLLEEKEIAHQIKKREENFFAEQRAKRAAAGRSVSFAQKRFAHFQTKGTSSNLFRIKNMERFCGSDTN